MHWHIARRKTADPDFTGGFPMMVKPLVATLALSLALAGCGMFQKDKPQPAPQVQVAPEPAPTPPPPPPAEIHHTVKKGETLAKLAKKYGVTTRQILQANHLKSAKSIKPGMKLTIPNKADASLSKPAKPGKAEAEPVVMGKKQRGKMVYDEAAYERVKAEFNTYAKNWLEKEANLSQSTKNRREVKQENGRYVATYSVIRPDTMQTEVKRVDYPDTPFVGHITYQMDVHKCYGTTAAAAQSSTKEEVSQESMREIFSFNGQKGTWR